MKNAPRPEACGTNSQAARRRARPPSFAPTFPPRAGRGGPRPRSRPILSRHTLPVPLSHLSSPRSTPSSTTAAGSYVEQTSGFHSGAVVQRATDFEPRAQRPRGEQRTRHRLDPSGTDSGAHSDRATKALGDTVHAAALCRARARVQSTPPIAYSGSLAHEHDGVATSGRRRPDRRAGSAATCGAASTASRFVGGGVSSCRTRHDSRGTSTCSPHRTSSSSTERRIGSRNRSPASLGRRYAAQPAIFALAPRGGNRPSTLRTSSLERPRRASRSRFFDPGAARGCAARGSRGSSPG